MHSTIQHSFEAEEGSRDDSMAVNLLKSLSSAPNRKPDNMDLSDIVENREDEASNQKQDSTPLQEGSEGKDESEHDQTTPEEAANETNQSVNGLRKSGVSVLLEVYSSKSKPQKNSSSKKPTHSKTFSKDLKEKTEYMNWIYKDKRPTKEDINKLILQKDEGLPDQVLIEAINKLKIDIEKIMAKASERGQAVLGAQQTQSLLEKSISELDCQIKQYGAINETNRNQIIENTKLMDKHRAELKEKKLRLKESTPKATQPKKVDKEQEAKEKKKQEKSKQNQILTLNLELETKRRCLQAEVEKIKFIDLKGQEISVLIDGISLHKESDLLLKKFIDELSIRRGQVLEKDNEVEYIEGNLMRDRHFILTKMEEKKKQVAVFQAELDHEIKKAKDSIQQKESEKGRPVLHTVELPEMDYNMNQYRFEAPHPRIKVFEEDMSQFSQSTANSRNSVAFASPQMQAQIPCQTECLQI
jgi:hypothetical protein